MMLRGEIWWADFGDARGSAPAYRHPALVLQRDDVNRSSIDTVVVCALTSNTRWASAPGNTLLPRRATKLPRATVANASQIATLDRRDLVERVSTLPATVMAQVEAGIRWFLQLES